MSDSLNNHEAPFSAAPGRKLGTDFQEREALDEDVNARAAAEDNESGFMGRTDGMYTTVPTSDSHSLTSGEGMVLGSPESEKGDLRPQETTEKLVVLRSWLFELIALLSGVLSFAGIVILLGAFNDQPQLEFARDVNINTIIAILSTALRAAMAFIATEVIGQSKGEWLEMPRPLRHVERLDNAGRGAWGSIKFLFFVSKPKLAVMGALLTIASYVLDPFSQQLAKTYPCNIASDEGASIFVARLVSDYNISERPLIWLAATTGLAGLTLSYGAAEFSKSQLFQCPSGNCTFPLESNITHTSVGICSTCDDVTSDVMERDLGKQSMTYQFPKQPNLNLTWRPEGYGMPYFRASTSNPTLDVLEPDSILSKTSIITVSAAACRNHSKESRIYNERKCRKVGYDFGQKELKKDMDVGVIAVSCSLSPCLRQYYGEVSLGTLQERLVSWAPLDFVTLNGSLQGQDGWWWIIESEPCEIKGRWYDSSNMTQRPQDSEFVIQGEVGFWGLDPASAFWALALARNGNATLESISASFDGMTAGYTDFMRGNWEEIQNERFNVIGVASKTTVCIRADWPWLVYPAVLLVSTTILLTVACVYSMREGGKRPVWKSTILPFLFYNLKMDRDQDQDQADESGMDVPLLQLKELETLADKTVARFSADATAPGFIVENGGTSSGASAGQQVGLLQRLFKPRAD
ncbi:hypothetical protein CcaCcLH18_07295 [Colletotrichum camelliae]|nr:hypothetical protein CcaCcLH18_07295 [Colletotrichum camelliae]